METNNDALTSVGIEQNGQEGFRYEPLETTQLRNRDNGQQAHRHEFYTLIWNQKSEGTHQVDFQDFAVEPNTLFILKPGQVHRIDLDRPHGQVLAFDEDFLMKSTGGSETIRRQDLRELLEENRLKISEEHEEDLRLIFERIASEYRNKRPYSTDLIQAYLHALLLVLNRQRFQNTPPTPEQVRKPHQITRQFMQLVEKHFRSYHEVKHYADMLHITRTHLNDTVKSVANKSAKEIIQDRLFLEAKRVAYFSNCSVKEITFELGFKNQTHFSKFFTRQAGESFMKFRKKIRSLYE